MTRNVIPAEDTVRSTSGPRDVDNGCVHGSAAGVSERVRRVIIYRYEWVRVVHADVSVRG